MQASVLVIVVALLRAAEGDARRAVEQALVLMERRDAGAEKALRAGLELAEREGDRWAEAESHRGLGVFYNRRADFRQARSELTQALQLHQRFNPKDPGLVRARNDLAFTEWGAGNHAEARRLYTQVLADYEALGDGRGKALALYNLAFITMSVEERLEKLIPAAIEAATALPDRRLEGKTRHLAGDTWYRAGDFRASLAELEAAEKLLDGEADTADRARVRLSVGRLYSAHGRTALAREYFERALSLQRKLGDRQGVVYSLGMLANTWQAEGDDTRAQAAAAEAVAVARQTGSKTLLEAALTRLGQAEIRCKRYAEALAALRESTGLGVDPGGVNHARIAQALLASGRPEEALGPVQEAVARAEKSKAGEYSSQALYWRARVLDALGRGREAVDDVRRSLAWQEKLRAGLIPTDYLKRGYSEGAGAQAGYAIDFLFRHGQEEEALAAAERTRARAFLDLLASRALDERSAPGGVSPQKGRDEPHIASLAAAPLPTVDGLREEARRSGSAILSYWCTESAVLAWAVRPDGAVKGVRSATGRARVEQMVRSAASLEGRRAQQALRELHGLLITPLAGALEGVERLVVIPHGPLHRLSFAALRDPSGKYLLEERAVTYLPAGSLLRFVGNREVEARRSLVVADPAGGPAGPGGERLPRLPAAGREAAAVVKAVGGVATLLQGVEASEASVRSTAAGKRVLHFATHGVLLDERPFESYLALGAGGGHDGRLTASEIYGLKLGADLVVLSACRSADGALTGDGIVGLTRAFFYAGASSLVATLWNVADEPSGLLVSRFYTHYGRLGKRDALRTAQLEVLRALRRGEVRVKTPLGVTTLPEHPVFWAGYILLGES